MNTINKNECPKCKMARRLKVDILGITEAANDKFFCEDCIKEEQMKKQAKPIDLRHKGEGCCDKCERFTFHGKWIGPETDKGKWRFICEWCAQEEGFTDAWTEEDEEDLAADRKFHMLRDEGKL